MPLPDDFNAQSGSPVAMADSEPAMLALVYDELRRLAAGYLNRERPDHTLQPTALVHEAYVRLLNQTGPFWRDPKQFRALAASVMRQILVDHARRHGAQKRGGKAQRITLDEAGAERSSHQTATILNLHDALERLNALDKRQGRVVELRFFGGLTNDEVAQVLGISRATVANDWFVARAWLARELDEPQK